MKKLRSVYKGYSITNSVNNKEYIGITSATIHKRWKLHSLSMQYASYKSALHRAMKKYGIENFTIQQIKKCDSWDELCLWEKQTIIERNTKVPNGYNITDGGDGSFGVKRSDEFKKALSERKKLLYSDPEKRLIQSINSKQTHNTPEALKKSKERSTNLWKNPEYRKKTTAALMKAKQDNPEPFKEAQVKRAENRAQNPEWRKKVKEGLIKAYENNPEWIETARIRNKEQAKNPEWRKKVKEGLIKAFETKPELKENASKRLLKYWEEPNTERRKHHAELMSKRTLDNLKNPDYIKWRLENPPGAKPVMYNFKYFRSTNEAANFFKLSRPTIERHILKNLEGCKKLNKNRKYTFEIQY